MRSLLMVSLAAASAFSGPAYAAGNAYGHDPKVCLVTFVSEDAAASQADVGVAKAQYLPLSIAMKLEMRSDSVSDIYTYGDDGYTGRRRLSLCGRQHPGHLRISGRHRRDRRRRLTLKPKVSVRPSRAHRRFL